MNEATLIVPPLYQARMTGVFSVRIGAQLIELLNEMLEPVKCARYTAKDQITGKSFDELIDFVDQRAAAPVQMTVQRFQQIAQILLKRHYGLDLGDTDLHDDAIVAECIARGLQPYQVLTEHAIEADLVRIDREGSYGVRIREPLTEADERAALPSA